MGELDEDAICEVTGLPLSRPSEGRWQEMDRIEDEKVARQRTRLEGLRIRFGVEEADLGAYDAAVSLVEEHCDAEVKADPADAARGDGWWYVPFGWIGCTGHIVYDDGSVVSLGSALTGLEWLWTVANGLRADVERFEVVITAVHDVQKAGRLMGRALPGGHGSKLIRLAQSDPVRFQTNWMLLRDLMTAEEEGLFDFQLVP